MVNKSILGTLTKDFSFFYGLPLILVVGLLFIRPLWDNPILTFIVFLFIDMGHAYATIWRTYFRTEEFSRTSVYKYLPVIVFLFIFFWAYLGLPLLWSFLLYFTFFHHIRQYYGISMWYAKKDGYKGSSQKIHLYLLTICPFIIFHFRAIHHQPLYHSSELFLFGENPWTGLVTMLYLIYLSAQILRWVLNDMGWGLKMSLIYPALIHAFCFLYFEDSFKAFIPLLVMHGVSYLVLVGYSMKKLRSTLSYTKIFFMITLLVLVLVLLESVVIDSYDVFIETTFLKGNVLLSSIASLAVLPNLLHYIIDGFIWKKHNPDFQKIID